MSLELKKSLGELLGLARGMLADQELSDSEIEFLRKWLLEHEAVARSFPGSVIHDRVEEVLDDGVITEEERSHLVETLNLLIEDRLEDLAEKIDITELWFDEAGEIDFSRSSFCLTGNFIYGPVPVCRTAIEERGGEVSPEVSDEIQFLVVGGLGVDEWREGGLGQHIETAMRMRATGKPVKIIPEDTWARQL